MGTMGDAFQNFKIIMANSRVFHLVRVVAGHLPDPLRHRRLAHPHRKLLPQRPHKDIPGVLPLVYLLEKHRKGTDVLGDTTAVECTRRRAFCCALTSATRGGGSSAGAQRGGCKALTTMYTTAPSRFGSEKCFSSSARSRPAEHTRPFFRPPHTSTVSSGASSKRSAVPSPQPSNRSRAAAGSSAVSPAVG